MRPGRLAINLVLVAVSILYVLPLLWMVLASVSDTNSFRLTWPSALTLDNFDAVLNVDTTYRPMLNSLLLCGFGTAVTVVASVLCAYRSRATGPGCADPSSTRSCSPPGFPSRP